MQARVALDDREQIVEIMRDSRGELADGLHLLHLPELVLKVEPIGDVLRHHENMRLARDGERLERDECGVQFLVAPDDLRLHVAHDFSLARRFQKARLVVQAQPEFERRVAGDFLAREAGHREKGVIHVHKPLRRERLDGLRNRAVAKCLRKAFLGKRDLGACGFQLGGPLRHHLLEFAQPPRGLPGHEPFFRQRVRNLQHLHVVERLLQQHQVLAHAELLGHRFP